MSLMLVMALLAGIGVDQKLGSAIDPGIPFRDENGATVRLGDLLRGRPVILTPVYFECPMLCSMQLNGLVRALRVMPFTAGKEFDVITFSIDPAETFELASAKKQHYVRDYGRPGVSAGWHFLTGDAGSIRRLTDDIGFRYIYDEPVKQWAHVSAIMALTPDGRVSQYFYGIEPDPADLKYALIEASSGKLGSIIDQALLFCLQYNAATGKYSLAIMRVVQLASLCMVLGLVAFHIGTWKKVFNSFPNRLRRSRRK
jgi:protein SCO1/2